MMNIVIRTAEEQWLVAFNSFMDSGVKVMAVESDSYANRKAFVDSARQYAKKFNLPVRVTIFCGVVRFERTDV